MVMPDCRACAFGAVAAAFVLAPGAGFVLFTSTALSRGRREALRVLAGMLMGMALVGVVLMVGARSLPAWFAEPGGALRWFGGSYLLWLGLRGGAKLLRSGGRGAADPVAAPSRTFLSGVLVSLTNPALLLLYLVVLPNYLPPQSRALGVAGLVTEHIAIAAAWYWLLLWPLHAARFLVRHRATRVALQGIASSLLALMGIGLLR